MSNMTSRWTHYKTTTRRKNTIQQTKLENSSNSPSITDEEVKWRKSNLKKKKAPGASKINAQILQHVISNIIEQITIILNTSISTGYMPADYKEAVIVLIPKGERDCKSKQLWTNLSTRKYGENVRKNNQWEIAKTSRR